MSSVKRFWSAPSNDGSGLPLPSAPPRLHRRKPSTTSPGSHRPVIYIYCPRYLQITSVLVVVGVGFALWVTTRNPAQHGRAVKEPVWLRDNFLDNLIPCEKGLPLPSSDDSTYVFPTSQSPNAHQASSYRALRPVSQDPLILSKHLPQKGTLGLPLSCLENAIAKGQPCQPGSAQPTPPELDVVWTWANGTDPLHYRARRIAEMAELRFVDLPRGAKKLGAEEKLFREHDELRHSIRSVLDNFRRWSKRYHILATDFPFPACNATDSHGIRLGQVPQWLNIDQKQRKDEGVSIDVIQHSEFMSDYRQTTFSSLSIESQFTNLNLSEAFIYMNDDVFFMSSMSPWDFYTYAYGPVLRMQSDLMVPPTTRDTKKANGEWQTLQYSNKLLGDRFGQRHRPYTTHEAKTLVKSMVDEVSITWNSELHHTGQQRFRLNPEAKDVYLPFLATHWIVERHREALLWSWVVARIGGDDDEWGPTESAQAWMELGGAPDADSVDIRRGARTTLHEAHMMNVLDSTGDATIGITQYAFLSRDGYPYSSLGRFGWKRWPSFQPSTGKGEPGMFSDPAARCTISRSECLGLHNSRIRGASGVFTHLAFEVPRCGDCIITALVASSGPLGLSSFLPAPNRDWKRWNNGSPESEPSPTAAPHLPLDADYRTANFTLASVLSSFKSETSSIRDWTNELIARYRFTIGITPSHFAMLRNANAVRVLFNRLEHKTHADDTIQHAAMLCLNDDIVFRPDIADGLMREWLGKKWPQKAGWEL